MDKLNNYRRIITEILNEYKARPKTLATVELEIIIDPQSDHYQVITVGWIDQKRVHGSILHLDIRDGKIWIQHDGTEDGVANRLVAAGVPKSDIVLGFQSPFKRQFTEFAQG